MSIALRKNGSYFELFQKTKTQPLLALNLSYVHVVKS